MRVEGLAETHSLTRLAEIPRLFAVNSALQVDLTGQVNSEAVNGRYLGGVGAQVDFIRPSSSASTGP